MTAVGVWRWSRRLGLLALAGGILAGLLRSGRRPPAGPRIARCPLHGIAYDADLEVCPECAKS